MQIKIPAAFWRGGTSRAVFFKEEDLASYDAPTRDLIILAALGSPDPYGRQIDGLGGGISSLSKVGIIGRGGESDPTVRFTFGQVDVERPFVDYLGTCGNMSAAVGPFAIDEGMIPAIEPVTPVRVLSTNTGKHYIAYVPVRDGRAETEGDYMIDGVPGPGARIALEFLDPGGSTGGRVLPTGHATDTLRLEDGRQVTVSLVDAAAPMVFVLAAEVGANATELPQDLDANQALQHLLEEIRACAAVHLGMAESIVQAKEKVKADPQNRHGGAADRFPYDQRYVHRRRAGRPGITHDLHGQDTPYVRWHIFHVLGCGGGDPRYGRARRGPPGAAGSAAHRPSRWHHGGRRQGPSRRRRLARRERHHAAHRPPHHGWLHLRAAELRAGETLVCVEMGRP